MKNLNRLRLFGLESLEELLFDNKPFTFVNYEYFLK